MSVARCVWDLLAAKGIKHASPWDLSTSPVNHCIKANTCERNTHASNAVRTTKWNWNKTISKQFLNCYSQNRTRKRSREKRTSNMARFRCHTTRCLARACWHRKKSWRAVSRLSDSTARHASHDRRDLHDTCSLFRGVATAWTGVDMSTSPFPELFVRLKQIQSTKDYTCTREHYTASSSSATHAQLVTSWHDTHECTMSWRVVTWCIERNLSLIVVYLYKKISCKNACPVLVYVYVCM